MWCLAGTEVSSAKSDVCDCKKMVSISLKNYKKLNKAISINELKSQGA